MTHTISCAAAVKQVSFQVKLTEVGTSKPEDQEKGFSRERDRSGYQDR